MKSERNKKYSSFISSSKLLVLVVIIFVLGFISIIILRARQGFIMQENGQINKMSSRYSCPRFGYQGKDEFLEKYTVQSGDSLLKIAKYQLNDVSKVEEIIALNKDRYPDISTKNSFLEKGWVLLLPPKDLAFNSSDIPFLQNLGRTYGALVSAGSNNDYWKIQQDSKGTLSTMKPNSRTKFIGKTNFQEGDCVIIIGIGTEILSIQPQ